MSKRKKIILCLILAVVVLGVGATMATLVAVMGSKTNKFHSGAVAMNVKLREPAWDGYTWDDPDPTGETAKDASDTSLGVNQAKSYSRGQTISKNPTVMNTSTDNAVYVAIRVKYQINNQAVNYSNFKGQLLKDNGLNFQDGWVCYKDDDSSGQTYIFGVKSGNDGYSLTSLAANTVAPSLFTQVPISDTVAITDGKLPTFKITVKAYAVQATGVSQADAIEALNNLIASNPI